MVLEPKCFGRLFLHDPSDFNYEDLEFVSRITANKKKAPNHRGQDEEPQGGYPHQISKPTKPAFSSSNLPAKYPKSFRTAATAAKDP